MKTVYLYDSYTGEYVSSYDAQESPFLPGEFIQPTHAMETPPPATSGLQKAVAINGIWQVVSDHRGTLYYLPDGSRHEITELGITPPLNALESAPVTVDQLLAAVYVERARRWRAGFPALVGGVTKWFHSDDFSLTQHLGLKDKARDLLAAGGLMTDQITIAGQPVFWSTMDGSQVAITAQVAFDLVAGAALQQALVFLASQSHEAAINAAEDLSDYDVLANWPAVFVD
ncbi:MAG: hypothetical protein Q8K07_09595 [Methylicorpusculum sp.]|uniref:DUF4376 domain-containing protein n=1 Tax=Methylicorpusculum sp. TaxID=2713644 RepID=UPI002730966E|nr:hypothetical protein [Methylicorpusculum sp.]MDP2202259.1 hypothetical protein [Methylicorpusculum sp.]